MPMAASVSAGQRVAGHPGPLDGQHSLQDGYPHRLTSAASFCSSSRYCLFTVIASTAKKQAMSRLTGYTA